MQGESPYVIGKKGENIAANYLAKKGYQIIDRNFRSCRGEIDIIAKKQELIVFAEVKNYAKSNWLNPRESINYKKKRNLLYTAQFYLLSRGYKDINCRFDLLVVVNSAYSKLDIEHIENVIS